jgi:hypothetical protein
VKSTMRSSFIGCAAFGVTILLANTSAFTQDISAEEVAKIQQRTARHVRTINGSSQAAAIPLAAKMEAWLRSRAGTGGSSAIAAKSALGERLKLTSSDATVLSALAQDAGRLHTQARDAGLTHLMESCEQLLDGRLDIVGFGLILNNLDEQEESRKEAAYQKYLGQLSREARAGLIQYLDTEVSQGVNYVRTDFAGMFSEHPEGFLQSMKMSCQTRIRAREGQGKNAPAHEEAGRFNASGNR